MTRGFQHPKGVVSDGVMSDSTPAQLLNLWLTFKSQALARLSRAPIPSSEKTG